MKAKTNRKWYWRILDFVNPLRDPSLTVAVVLTFIEEVGQHDVWYWIILIGLVNWLAVRGVVWLIVNFTFAFTFIARRLWWAIRHPRLAWRILDAVGHEEIVIGGFPGMTEGMVQFDMNQMLTASGIHVIGELPAGTEIPMLGMANGQVIPDLSALAGSGVYPGKTGGLQTGMYNNGQNMGNLNGMNGNGNMGFPQAGRNDFVSEQTTGGLPQAFPQRPSQEEERLRQQVAAFSRLMDDWMQFTEEKWRTVSDSQLGWKPLRGRWAGWEDIFQDVYAAQTSDPMAKAAQAAGEATSRRFDNSKEKGSAASAVACFLRDMMTLRRGLEMMQSPAEYPSESPTMQPVSQPMPQVAQRLKFGGTGNGHSRGGSGSSPRNTLIRRPAQIFVDADSDK